MTVESAYQNQEMQSRNPLPPPVEAQTRPPMDPKVRLLIILGSVVFCLLFISWIISAKRSSRLPNIRRPSNPTVYPSPRPSDTPDTSKLPADLKIKFDRVDTNIQTEINFTPPRIDPDIGL